MENKSCDLDHGDVFHIDYEDYMTTDCGDAVVKSLREH